MMDDWVSQEFMVRLKKGEFDENLLETIASLSTEELTEVEHALEAETDSRSLVRH